MTIERRVDIESLRRALAGAEALVAAQAHLPVSERLRAQHPDGTVIEDVASASVRMLREWVADVERRRAGVE